jgi:carboxyl-terminal processing protease
MRIKLILMASLALTISFSALFNTYATGVSAREQEAYEHLKTFSDTLSILQKNYVDHVDIQDLIYNSIKGMVSNLDPHSSFMPPDIYKELQVETKGSFGGLGIEITIKDGVLTVVAPIEDTPAFNAGIKTGDRIIMIEKESTKSMSLVDAVKKMRGKPQTKISITIMRDDVTEPLEFVLVRDIITIKSVRYHTIDDAMGYIRVAQFQENTVNDFTLALEAITAETGDLKGMIIDLRGNPGGLLDQAVKLADMFLDSGLIVYTEGRTEDQKTQFFATENSVPYFWPTIVLVNGGSASASEIVAGALQDHGKAVLVGTPTFGKGTVQTIYPLSDGSGLRITTAKYYTPGHRSIQEKGIIPDIIVEDTEESYSGAGKKIRYFREKDLLNHFKNNGEASEAEKEVDTQQGDSGRIDPPLQTAIHILKSWDVLKRSAEPQPAPDQS